MAREQWTWLRTTGWPIDRLRVYLDQQMDRLQRVLVLPDPLRTLTYGTTVTPDLRGQARAICPVTVTDTTAFVIAAPTNAEAGAVLWFDILNSSGGVMGAITWNAVYKRDASYANPANGKRRTIGFYKNGSTWIQLGAASGDQ